MVVVVTGSSGQLGQALQFIAPKYPEITFHFCNSAALDITKVESIEAVFETVKPDFCINAAAYTAVDKAESEPEKARLVNVTGAQNLAKACKKHNTVLLHISTDFVFDGYLINSMPFHDKKGQFPLRGLGGFSEEDTPNPTGVYGQTKLDGEKAIQEIWERHFIIRTSWVYSQFGNNFIKTMLRLGTERDSLSVVNDQIGTPTHAVDLAEALVKMITFCHAVPQLREVSASQSRLSTSNFQLPTSIFHLPSKVFNFSNEGQCSWYDFAKKIFEINKIKIDLQPISTSSYPTPAKRPAYSVLDKTKIKTVFDLEIKDWEERLRE